MAAGYAGTAGAAYDELLDGCAQSCADDQDSIVACFSEPDLRTPQALITLQR